VFLGLGSRGAARPQFQQLYDLSNTQTNIVVAEPVILGSLFRVPMGLVTDHFGGSGVFAALMLVVSVWALFTGLKPGYPAFSRYGRCGLLCLAAIRLA
jgi:nitrate/nitrite transporter NarK